MTTSAPDRLFQALRRVNDAINPRLAFSMTWEYQVIIAEPGPPVKIDCEVLDPETAGVLPQQLVGIVMWPGPSGFVAQPAPGTVVRIGFVNGDPSKPFVAGLDPNSQPMLVMGFAPIIQLGSAAAEPLTKAAWAEALATTLTTFATGLNPTTLAAQAAALVTALGLLPPAPTTEVLGT